ncbi:hypothetical protein IF1G_07805 [Cordyceps javanica]|uniref:Uncharacterized protein n=1 Tax=Cordyceps javanica TaxID=43265 RepID=A0A545UUT2_9HYPO|nr:hypothetical protein IF1G_07805 [Cordyceps javanica]
MMACTVVARAASPNFLQQRTEDAIHESIHSREATQFTGERKGCRNGQWPGRWTGAVSGEFGEGAPLPASGREREREVSEQLLGKRRVAARFSLLPAQVAGLRQDAHRKTVEIYRVNDWRNRESRRAAKVYADTRDGTGLRRRGADEKMGHIAWYSNLEMGKLTKVKQQVAGDG